MENTKLNELENKIQMMLEDKASWTLSKHSLTHTTGLALWVCNGIETFGIYKPIDVKLPVAVSARLWVKIEAMLGKSVELAIYGLATQEAAEKMQADEQTAEEVLEAISATTELKAVA